ncbi:type I DNA topoisomerase [Dietzia sp.]|uniref:type I DNA topoisomerase n=1 Tax=Dietzia sp. TaxID=1871616 RepID=UPI002FD98325
MATEAATGTKAGSDIKRLVIVESATKAKKIQQFLGSNYVVEASVGHIRDLPSRAADVPAKYKKEPWARFGVDPDNDFEPIYVVDSDKAKKVATLRRELKGVDELLLATDPDREGEAIAWHLLEVLKPKVPVKRMVFHEITEPAIREAVDNTRELDQDLVDAQETRRILDRLYGYEVSPVLWKKIQRGLSAGRVQSVATRIIVERERERMAFISANYWDIEAEVSGEDSATGGRRTFPAKLAQVEGKRVAQGRDFGPDGKLKAGSADGQAGGAAADVVTLDEAAAKALAGGLEKAEFEVSSVESKPYTRRPSAPFMTSTLQQEAGRKLRFTSSRTMRVAQRLYENGYITYMRTDSTTLSAAGTQAARDAASTLFGSEYVADAPRRYDRKVKNSQEAHEAIRPAGESFQTPGELRPVLSAEEHLLYDLIWKRTLASQMADARGTSVSVKIAARAADNDSGFRDTIFNASGRTIAFPGFLRVFDDDAMDDEPGDGKGKGESRLPQLAEGQTVSPESISPEGHSTNPPARYTEASLVKAMEEMGIGRPSTYASIINTIQARGYVYSRGNALVPSWLAFPVVRLLEENFGTLVDYDFTSLMEDDLDRIASGQESRTAWLKGFYFGRAAVEGLPEENDRAAVGLKHLVDDRLAEIDAASLNSIRLFEDTEGRTVYVRNGRYGPYLMRRYVDSDGEQQEQRANLPIALNPDELTLQVAEKLFAIPQEGRKLGEDPETTHEIVVKDGPYGPYVAELLPKMGEEELEAARAAAGADVEAKEFEKQLGDGATDAEAKKAAKKVAKKAAKDFQEPKGKMASLFKSMDAETVTLEEALRLLSLPRVVGTDPSDGKEITAQNGRYGPYLRKGNDSRSLGSEEELFTVTLDDARRIYSEPKRRGRSGQPSYLKDLGDDPVTSKKILVKDGRFGPYVTDGDTIASLGKGDTPETVTPDRASELLSARRDQQRAAEADPDSAAAKKAAKKTPAKKTARKSSGARAAAKTGTRVAKKGTGTKKASKTGVSGVRKAAAKSSGD